MALSYSAGLVKVLNIAQQQRTHTGGEHVPLHDTVGGIVAADVVSPFSIPRYTTSAMDGYAIHSQATVAASEQRPVLFRVHGTMAAGDNPDDLTKGGDTEDELEDSNDNRCVEIMTGAIFPDGYDACVKIEDTVPVNGPTGRHILVTKPIRMNANRRFAGCDIFEEDVVVKQGEVVQSSHILALAALGFETLPLAPKPRLGIWSTGNEMVNGKGATRDCNGPYLTAAAKEMGLHADFLGVLDDEPVGLHDRVRAVMDSGTYDVLITSGAVSKGKFDHVRSVLDELGADIVFHGLAMRPGHPALFALIPGLKGKTAFFGLPGNPGAAAACFRFLTVPYLQALQGQAQEQPIIARLLQRPGETTSKHGCRSMQNTDCFRHGVLSTSAVGQLIAEPSTEQSPAKVGPFITANCWIHIRPDDDATPSPNQTATTVDCYPISPTGSIHLAPSLLN